METQEILKELSVMEDGMLLPRAAMKAAVQQKETMAPILLDRLEAYCARVQDPDYNSWNDPDNALACYSYYLLAEMREPRFFPIFLRILSVPDPDRVLSDILTEDASSLLYSTWNGDLESTMAFVTNPDRDPFARHAVMDMLVALCLGGSLPRETLLDLLRSLLTVPEGAESDENFLSMLTESIASAHLFELLGLCQELQRRRLVDPIFSRGSLFLDRLLSADPPSSRVEVITDAVEALRTWPVFREEPDPAPAKDPSQPDDETILSWNVGRNDPCPCGSGKKFKKCHLPIKQELMASRSSGTDGPERARAKTELEKLLPMPEDPEPLLPYPSLTAHDGIPGLLDLFPEDAVEVDREAWLGINMAPIRIVDIVFKRQRGRKEAVSHLWSAFQRFQSICAEKGLRTLMEFDRDHMVHYESWEWLTLLEHLLENDRDPRRKEVQAVLGDSDD